MAPGAGPKDYVISPYVVERAAFFSFDQPRWLVAPALSALFVVMIAGAVQLGNGLADRLLSPYAPPYAITVPDDMDASGLAQLAALNALAPSRSSRAAPAVPALDGAGRPMAEESSRRDGTSLTMRDLLVALAPIPRPRPEAVVPEAVVPVALTPGSDLTGPDLAGSDLSVPARPQIGTAPRAAAAMPEPVVLRVESGDTLMQLLTSAGVAADEAFTAITALQPSFKPRQLQPGQEIHIRFAPDAEAQRLEALTIKAAVDLDIALTRGADGSYAVEEVARPLAQALVSAQGRIDSSLYKAGADARVPDPVLANLIQIFSFDVDFQRDVHPGDSFQLLFESFRDDNGRAVRHGEVLVAELTLGGKTRRLYRHAAPDGAVDYYDATGQSIRRALLRTPIDGARMSSGYGMRRHPILGYSRMHRGIDFAAPTGTPIFAAGDGVIEMAGWNGGYGRYIRIRHDGSYSTAYAHLHSFARGIGKGRRVRQGQIIGHVGTTGQSTGPHLHYEVLKNGSQVDPQSVKLPTGRTIAGAELAEFKKSVAALEKQIASAPSARQVALAGSSR